MPVAVRRLDGGAPAAGDVAGSVSGPPRERAVTKQSTESRTGIRLHRRPA
jgi:hypothetical protein